MQIKKTKIIATIGPKSESVEILTKLINNGMNIARINMSHGDIKEHSVRIKNIREAENITGEKISILLDLSGPKIRTGKYTTEKITLTAGKKIIVTSEEIIGDENKIFINHKNLAKEITVGSIIMLNDGKRKLEVESIEGDEIICKIIIGGEIDSFCGVNILNAKLSIEPLTEKDIEDLNFGLNENIDMVALSFVRSKNDILALRNILNEKDIPVIAKIETQLALNNLDEIIEVSDGLMVARGDLAIEVDLETVPLHQKEIIKKCNDAGKFVITATQMMESMLDNPTPTRAEVSDIANAILDGTDMVMLSEETAVGNYPVEAVTIMNKEIIATEEFIENRR